MHKGGKWANEIIAMQHPDGKWGWFHSLSQFYNSTITTEQALRRLERLGYTMEDECIQRAVAYMDDCLSGKDKIPDRVEKVSDWNVFSSLILATGIRKFTKDNVNANRVAEQWAEVASCAFADGGYNHDAYISAYKRILKPSGGRINGFATYYPVSLLDDCLDEKTERAFIDYLLNNDSGIYYIYDRRLAVVPQDFEGKDASRYLGAIELLARYNHSKDKLSFVVDWLEANKNGNGKWDMGKSVNDKVYFPLSDNWRKAETREADCTERITRLMNELGAGNFVLSEEN